MRSYIIGILLLQMVAVTSCVNTRRTTYFNNAMDTVLSASIKPAEALIQKKDVLSISISSLNQDASAIFNTTNGYVTSISTPTGVTTQVAGYLVDGDGYIQLPILGNIRAEGLTKKELKENITMAIINKRLLVDPIVNIRHMNYEVTVIGEVGHPTVITVPNEKISLLKALGLAGDITIYGRKDNVLLIRDVNGVKDVRRINLNVKEFLNSPYYYLMPNDVVYVEANKNKVSSVSRTTALLPVFFSGLSLVVFIIGRYY